MFEIAAANTCPNCDKRGQYDGNVTRMVLRQNGMSGSRCRVACGAGMPASGMGMGMHGHRYADYAPGMAYQSGIMPGQVLSPLQQQIEARKIEAELRKMQFHPNQGRDQSRCCVM